MQWEYGADNRSYSEINPGFLISQEKICLSYYYLMTTLAMFGPDPSPEKLRYSKVSVKKIKLFLVCGSVFRFRPSGISSYLADEVSHQKYIL
jgi:hypothetical protein